MREITLAIAFFAVLATNLTMEYGTLTRRYSLAVHVLVRCLSLVPAFCIVSLLIYFELGGNYLFQSFPSLSFYSSLLLLFEERFAQKTFLFFMDYTATSFLSAICVWGVSMLPFGEAEPIAQIALFIVITLFLLVFYLRSVRLRVRKMLFFFRESNPLYALFPFLSFIFFRILFGPEDVSKSVDSFALMMLYMSIVVLVYYLLFSHFYVVYSRLQADSFLARAEQRLALQKKYYEEVDRGIEAQEKLLHDTRHHMVAIASLAKAGDVPAIAKYAERLLESRGPPGIRKYCANSVINAVLGGYAKIAEEKGIDVSVDVDFPESIGINEYELCTLIGNTFENAIEACGRIPASSGLYGKRFVSIKSRTEDSRLLVRVENSFQGDPGVADVDLRSGKGSGLGLKSVRKVVDLYEGSMSCDRRGDVFVFSAVLCLKSSKELSIL